MRIFITSFAYIRIWEENMARAYVLINTEAGQEQEVVKQLKTMATIKEAYAALVESEKIDDLKNVISYELRKLNGVRSTVTMMVAEGKIGTTTF
jgi:DNA-binding Lrp family transcriptional regulator